MPCRTNPHANGRSTRGTRLAALSIACQSGVVARQLWILACCACVGALHCGGDASTRHLTVGESEDVQQAGDMSPPTSETPVPSSGGTENVFEAPTTEATAGYLFTETPATSGPPETEQGCYVPAPRDIPAPTNCSSELLACEPGSDECLSTPLTTTLQKLLHDACDVYCGELEIGLSDGCVTLVDGLLSNASQDECARDQVLGRRWQCAPSEGIARIALGSCTLPP